MQLLDPRSFHARSLMIDPDAPTPKDPQMRKWWVSKPAGRSYATCAAAGGCCRLAADKRTLCPLPGIIAWLTKGARLYLQLPSFCLQERGPRCNFARRPVALPTTRALAHPLLGPRSLLLLSADIRKRSQKRRFQPSTAPLVASKAALPTLTHLKNGSICALTCAAALLRGRGSRIERNFTGRGERGAGRC